MKQNHLQIRGWENKVMLTLVSLLGVTVVACDQVRDPSPGIFSLGAPLTVSGEYIRDDRALSAEFIAISPAMRVAVLGDRGQGAYVFDSADRFMKAIALPPHTRACCLTFESDRELWYYDRASNEYVAISLASSPKIQPGLKVQRPASGLMTRIGWRSGGQAVRHVSDSLASSGEVEILVQYISRNGRVLQSKRLPSLGVPADLSVVVPNRGGTGTAVLQQPFGPRFIRATGPSGNMAIAVSNDYSITLLDDSGRATGGIRRSSPAPELSRRERSLAQRELDRIEEYHPLAKGRFILPQTKQAIVDVGFSLDGNLWIMRSVADGTPQIADVFRKQQYVGSETWASDIRINNWSIRGDRGYGESDRGGRPGIYRIHFAIPVQ